MLHTTENGEQRMPAPKSVPCDDRDDPLANTERQTHWSELQSPMPNGGANVTVTQVHDQGAGKGRTFLPFRRYGSPLAREVRFRVALPLGTVAALRCLASRGWAADAH